MSDNVGLIVFFMLVVYVLPSIVASVRHHRNKSAITALNILLGWTLLGWIGAFIWACTADVIPKYERRAWYEKREW